MIRTQGIVIPRAPLSNKPTHTNECSKLIERPYPRMSQLDEVQQGYILCCPHPDHDGVRRYMGFKEQLDAVTRQPVRIHAT